MENWKNGQNGQNSKLFDNFGKIRTIGTNSKSRTKLKIQKLCHNATEKQQNRSKEARRTDARGCFVFRKGLGVNRVLNCGLECNAYKNTRPHVF